MSNPEQPLDPPVAPTQPPTEPPAPPAAPEAPSYAAPAAPAAPPLPRYGEYAPPGYVSPVAQAAQDAQAPVAPPAAPRADGYAAPQYLTPQAPAQAPLQPPVGPPLYGQQTAVPPVYGQPGQPIYGQPVGYASGPVVRTRKTWDVVLTIILLVLGFFGALIGVFYGAVINNDVIAQAFAAQGYGEFTGDVGSIPTVLVVSHILLYLLAVGISIPMLIKRRITFWVPLSIGVLAAIIFWGSLFSIFLSDPNFMSTVGA